MVFSRSFLATVKSFSLSFGVITISTPSPIAVRAQNEVAGFSYVDYGPCRDSFGTFYDYYSRTSDNAADCGSACVGIGIDGLKGFTYVTNMGLSGCFCEFNNNIVTSTLPDGFDQFNSGYSGTGDVVSGNNWAGYYCYKRIPPPPTASPISILSKYSTIDADFGFSDATLAAGSSSLFQLEFTNSIPASTIHAAIIANTFCTDTNSNFEIKDGVTNAVGPVVVDATHATITKDVESEVAASDKNDGAATLRFCLRADLYDDSDDTVSIGARKVNLQLDITYVTESDFSVTNILTSEFVASSTSTSATNAVSIKVFKDSCDSGCEIVDGDSGGCFADANKVKIGDTLALCMMSEAADVDLIGIESAKVDAADYSSAIVEFKEVGSAGTNNFVTTTSVANGQVTLETLLLPAYYDALDGGVDGSLAVSGTILLSYVDMNRRRLGRELQGGNQVQDESPFSVNIPLENQNGNPEIAQERNGSSAASFSVIDATIITMIVISSLMGILI